MGTGGITSGHQITLETRDVQPTHLGFLDPLATPESGKVGVTVGLASTTEKTEEGLVSPVIDKNGKILKITPAEFYNSVVGMPDQYNYIVMEDGPEGDGTTPYIMLDTVAESGGILDTEGGKIIFEDATQSADGTIKIRINGEDKYIQVYNTY